MVHFGLPSASLRTAFASLRFRAFVRHALLPALLLGGIAVTAFSLYLRSHAIMGEHLREYLRATAASAAMQFDGMNPALYRDPSVRSTLRYADTVRRLNALRRSIAAIRYVYIMERTDDPLTLRFLADADSLKTVQELDVDGNGTVSDDEQPSFPGDLYSIDDNPALQGPAFAQPTVDEDITVDAWGSFVSAYAPIHGSDGAVVAVLGIDMKADVFRRLSYSIFSVESLLLLLCGGLLFALYVGLELWRRRMQSAAELEADRKALLNLASHQFGGPLTTFKWWLEILKDREGGRLCRESDICVQMDEGVRRMDEIVRALRTIGTETPAEHAVSCDVASAAQQASHEAAVVLRRKRQECVCELSPSLPAVRIDPALLRGVLEELIENASSYSPEEAHIIVKAVALEGAVRVSVVDSGDGMDPDDLRHIAQKFIRGKSAVRRKPVGNGLGLWLVRTIIERAQGKFWVESTPGKGTTVNIELPIAA